MVFYILYDQYSLLFPIYGTCWSYRVYIDRHIVFSCWVKCKGIPQQKKSKEGKIESDWKENREKYHHAQEMDRDVWWSGWNVTMHKIHFTHSKGWKPEASNS